jgi:competence protein ComEC
MWKLICLITFLFLLSTNILPKLWAEYFLFFHNFCLSLSPQESFYRDYYSAIVCGYQPPPSLFLQALRGSGLYHLIIVSGAHFIFLEALLALLFLKRRNVYIDVIIATVLFFYALTTLLTPPVTRALLTFLLQKVNQEEKLFWRGWHSTLGAGILTLLIYPQWILSWSFLLSWCAALLISQTQQKSAWQQSIWLFLGLAPIIMAFQTPRLAFVLSNLFLAPILGYLLFPLCILAMLAHIFAKYLCDYIWWGLDFLFSHTMTFSDLTGNPLPMHLGWGWVYVFLLQATFFFYNRNKLQAQLC